MSEEADIRRAYDGSSTAFRALEGGGWGELVNLGFYPLYAIPGVLFGLGPFQRLLARRSVALVEPRPGMRVIDAGCGRGYTTARLAEAGCEAIGIDLLVENTEAARARYSDSTGAHYATADVTRLPASASGIELAPGSFDAVHCLEVAFHFGAKGRSDFLAESYRMLRPGGRLVLVDFVWRDSHPERIDALDPLRLVRDTWRFTEFEPFERYRSNAASLGFREREIRDWTRPVIDRFQRDRADERAHRHLAARPHAPAHVPTRVRAHACRGLGVPGRADARARRGSTREPVRRFRLRETAWRLAGSRALASRWHSSLPVARSPRTIGASW